MKILIHSISAAITNSSTSIYMWASYCAIENTKKFFNQILKAAGVSQSADDLFKFKIEQPDVNYEDFEEKYLDEYPDNTEADAKTAYENALENDAARPEWWDQCPYHDFPTESKVIVTAKDNNGISLDMLSYFNSIFEMDAEQNG